MSSIIYNQIVRPPGTATDDHLHDGVNTQSRIVCLAVDVEATLNIPHTLSFHPKWVDIEEARGPLSPNPMGLSRVFCSATETVTGPNPATDTFPHFDVGGTPLSGTGTVAIRVSAPRSGTEYVYFTMHLGRHQSSPK